MAQPVVCACGRTIAFRNFKPHARKCFDQLSVWSKDRHNMALLDERSEADKKARPIPNNYDYSGY